MAKNDLDIHLWKNRLATAKAFYKSEYEEMDRREALYAGTHEVIPANGAGPAKQAGNVRNIVYELIESGVDCAVPVPQVNAASQRGEALAKNAETLLRAEVEALPFKEMNDLTYNGWYGTSFHVFNSSSVGARIKSTFAAMNATNGHSGARVENSNITFATGTQISNKHYGIFASGNAHVLFQDIVVNNCTAALGSAASHIYFDWNTTQISGALYRSAGGLITKGAGVDV